MTKQMKAASSKSKEGAALAERNGEVPEIEFREVKLTLPKAPLASVMWRMGRLRDNDVVAGVRLVESLIGAEQLDKVLDRMDEEGLTIEDEEGATAIGKLINDALAAYGLAPGESEASADS